MFVNQDSISIIQDSVIDSIIQDNVIPSIIQDSVVDSIIQDAIIQDRDICICCRCVALDETTVVTNRVIVAAGLIGGPSERSLPPLSPSLNPYPCPLVTDHPLPECFHGNTVALETQLETGIVEMCTMWFSSIYTDSPLYKLVESGHAPSRNLEGAWLGELREMFCEEVLERCALSNDCEFVTTLHHLSSPSPRL